MNRRASHDGSGEEVDDGGLGVDDGERGEEGLVLKGG